MHEERRFTMRFLSLAVALSFLAACSGGGGTGGGGDDGGDTIPLPVANAGLDQVVLAGSLVSLDGSGSTDAEAYNWSFTSWPAGMIAVLSSKTVSNPTFTTRRPGSYEISLVVSNSTKTSAPDSVTVTAINPAPVPDTGQDECYNSVGHLILCAESGQDAAYNAVNQPSYTDNGDETITDNVTGLMWQQCTLGRRGDNCTVGTLGSYNWYAASGTAHPDYNPDGAANACGDLKLAGHPDWRLPTEAELMTLVDYSGYHIRAIHNTYFPGTQTSPYWSSNAYADPIDDTAVWYLGFTDGTAAKTLKTSLGRVRCVRGALFSPFFIDNGDGTVTDFAAGLIWQKQDEGIEKSWEDAIAYCEGLSLGGRSDWRLPNEKELYSIVDAANRSPAVDSTYFPGTQPYPYWSSTTDADITNQAWTIDFTDGATGQSNKGGAAGIYARCIRDQ